jgi:hypothetical protein
VVLVPVYAHFIKNDAGEGAEREGSVIPLKMTWERVP